MYIYIVIYIYIYLYVYIPICRHMKWKGGYHRNQRPRKDKGRQSVPDGQFH